jgi:hypothetical protein
MRLLFIGETVGIMIWIARRLLRFSSEEPEAANEASRTFLRPGAVFLIVIVELAFLVAVLLFASIFFGPAALRGGEWWDASVFWATLGKLFNGEFFIGVIYFLIMLAGMAGEYMFGLKSLKKFTFTEFVRPFWVSLIVFSVPWSLVDKSALTFASVLACYQNGFFWKSVLGRRRSR